MSLYLYALLDAAPAAPLGEGLAGEPLRLVRCGGILAAVGEMTAAPRPEAPLLQAHAAVLRRLGAGAGAALPARFGGLAAEAELAERLGARAALFAEALERVRGCVQMTLRVFGTAAAPAGLDPLPEDPAAGPGTRFLAARRREHERRTALPEIESLRPALGPLLRAERVERQASGPLIGTAFHLLPREAEADYRAVLEATGGRLPGGFRLAWSGPWPPYAFATVAGMELAP